MVSQLVGGRLPIPPPLFDLAPLAAVFLAFLIFTSLPLSFPSFGRGKRTFFFWFPPERWRPNASSHRYRQREKKTLPFAPRHFHLGSLSRFFPSLTCCRCLSLSLLLGGANAEFFGLSRGAHVDSGSQSTPVEETEIVLFPFGTFPA